MNDTTKRMTKFWSTKTPEERVEEWQKICRNRDATVKMQGDEWVELKNEIDGHLDTITRLKNRLVWAVENLKKYGEHTLSCQEFMDAKGLECCCGLDAALKGGQDE